MIRISCSALLWIACSVSTAMAGPILMVDVDPTTAGIQSTRDVVLNDVFSVDIVVADNGLGTFFDTVILETYFNDAGNVLSLGPAGQRMGTLQGSPFALDLFGGTPLPAAGDSLAVGLSSPLAGYAGASGTIGLFDPFVFSVTTNPVTIYSIDFKADQIGSSTILATGSPAPFSPAFALGGNPIALGGGGLPLSGQVNVLSGSSPVPEPTSLVLFALGGCVLLGYGAHGRKQRRIAPSANA